jgi:hypothetical protein
MSDYMFIAAHKSGNSKLGQLASVYAPWSTCPPACPLMSMCYARKGLCGLVAKKYAHSSFADMLDGITSVHEGLPWRWGVLGDLPGIGNVITRDKLKALVARNEHRLGFTYTHKPLSRKNVELIKWANTQGFTINVSVESLAQVDAMNALGLPCATVVPSSLGDWRHLKTNAGALIIRCPAEYAKTQCATCGGSRGPLCARSARGFAIGLTSHGNCRMRLDRMLLLEKNDVWKT